MDFTTLSNKELSEAIDFHRRQRNMSRGVNESAHMRQTQVVRLLEAEETRRLEEVELDEDTMPSNVAGRLSDRHFTAAFHHKKMGNMKGYAAHVKVANRIEDAVIRAGSHMPIKSKQIEAASDKAFKEHPHRVVKTEEVELDEGHYHVSWGGPNLSHTVMNAKSAEHAVASAKAHLIKKIPKLADEKYSDTFDKKPRVTNITNEEVEQIDELSRSTLGSYANKALNRGDIAARMSKSDTDAQGQYAAKRLSGAKLAAKKLGAKVGDKATATRVATNIDKAKTAAANRYTDKDDEGKAYYAAQRGVAKLQNQKLKEEADLTKIDTKTLQGLVQLHKHYGQKDAFHKAAADRGEAELKSRMKKEEVSDKKWDESKEKWVSVKRPTFDPKKERGRASTPDQGQKRSDFDEEVDLDEAYETYHPSYTSAINAALSHHGHLSVSDEDRDHHIASGPRKPSEGNTVSHNIPATDKAGNSHMIHVQVYNKGGNKPFELNTYSSKVPKKKLKEAVTADVMEPAQKKASASLAKPGPQGNTLPFNRFKSTNGGVNISAKNEEIEESAKSKMMTKLDKNVDPAGYHSSEDAEKHAHDINKHQLKMK